VLIRFPSLLQTREPRLNTEEMHAKTTFNTHVAPEEQPVILGKIVHEAEDQEAGENNALLHEAEEQKAGENNAITGSPAVGSPATRKNEGANRSRAGEEQAGMARHDTFDGLRGLGVLLVVAYHLRFGARSAWVCIGLFFALSGLLMTSKVLQIQGKKGEFSILHFWKRRILRLIPAFLALMLCILCKSCMEWSVYGRPEGVELHYLRNDLLWALAYGENWNLVNQQEDYFADVKKASVVRHVWSLSIEEQYYILWPIIFAVITKLVACCIPAQTRDCQTGNTSIMLSMRKPDVQYLVKVLCFFEVCAIVFSQFVCVHVYETFGESAAYFSTYARAGEFAVGGLSACLLHLSPWSLAIFTRDPGRPPLTQNQRIGLEIASAVTVLSILECSVIPLPLSDLFSFYFQWFRLPFTIIVLFGASLQSLQTSETLPPWAIFTRVMSSKLLVYFGTTSYGLYLIHWVLVVWFGDSQINTVHSSATLQGRMEGATAWSRDFLIAAASIAISGASFWFFERPVMMRVAHLKPGAVIGISLASMAAMAILVVAVTQGAVDPAAVETIQDQLRSVPWEQYFPTNLLFLGDSQAKRIAEMMREVCNNASQSERCASVYGDHQPWGPWVINGAQGAASAIDNFASAECTWCKRHIKPNRPYKSAAKKAVSDAMAPYIYVIDSHFLRPWIDGSKKQEGLWGMESHMMQALYRMIQFSAWHGAQHIFLSTGSPFIRHGDGQTRDLRRNGNYLVLPHKYKKNNVNNAMRQRKAFLQLLKGIQCKHGSYNSSEQRLLVSIVDYHKLVCPDFNENKEKEMGLRYRCNQSGPGFKKKLGDDLHAEGPGGFYLVRQVQRVIFHGIARQGTYFSQMFRTPLTCYDELYEKEEDGLEELLQTFEVCVARDEKAKVAPVDLRLEQVQVDLSLGRDIYMCRFFELPKLKVGMGITSVNGLLQDNSWQYIHHISYFSCDLGFEPAPGSDGSFECTHVPLMDGCNRTIYRFAPGSQEFRLPEGYMYTIDWRLTLLQVHYKMVKAESLVDSTGVRVNFGEFLTTVQFFELGPREESMLSIPPRSERHVVQSVCSPDDVKAALERYALNEFKIIGVLQHMHLAGIAAKTEVLHPNGTSTAFGVMPEYDLHRQDMRPLPGGVVVSKGDALKVTCVYNTQRRAQKTRLGISLTDEMCFSYMLTTPRLPLFSNCWHTRGTRATGAQDRFFAGLRQPGPEGDTECHDTTGRSFSVEPTVAVRGLHAKAARAKVFQAPAVCAARDGGSRRRGPNSRGEGPADDSI